MKLSDDLGRKRILSPGLIGTTVSLSLFAIRSNLYWLHSSRVFGGIFSAWAIPAASFFVSGLLPLENRGKVLE